MILSVGNREVGLLAVSAAQGLKYIFYPMRKGFLHTLHI